MSAYGMRVLIFKRGSKREEVHAINTIGEEWEFELKNCIYVVDEGHFLKTMNMTSSHISSIRN